MTSNREVGTVVDRDIAHPTEFDFYLQSHGGLLGEFLYHVSEVCCPRTNCHCRSFNQL
ncbi:hypothetical protein R3P38DRAFT_3129083 [Favolaschia claudopus]|uniref:Uncharacterized protein n=1 Tax=Favolaschia claudopus TaxID=2862362 RepID=A0AAV9ZA83_9AGAR